uniref:TNF receptor-associated factor n=2 Tax=Petromyzon marinus TaxID=7757 RepID=A0A6M4S0L4_PETMA|nr:TNF receptor associated factor 3b [Petromyzon marinus]
MAALLPGVGPSSQASSLHTTLIKDGAPASYLPASVGGEAPTCGYREHFVQPPEDKYRCELCRLPLRDPRQTECGHRFCEPCIRPVLSKATPACPVDNELLQPDQVFRDNCCRREILALRVHCRNDTAGCKQIVELGKLQEHMAVCVHEAVNCPHAGCTERLLRGELVNHVALGCHFRTESCRYCNQQVPLAEKRKHYETRCPRYPIPCPNKCEEQSIAREELVSHLGICPYKQAECFFSQFGCKYKGTLQGLKEHESGATQQHLSLVTARSANLELKVSMLQSQLAERANSADLLGTRVRELEKELISVGQTASKNESVLCVVQRMLAVQTERLLRLQESMQGTTRRADHDALRGDLDGTAATLHELGTRVAAIEESGGSVTHSSTPTRLAALDSALSRHDTQLFAHDTRLAEMDLRFQVLETASYNGKLVWKIRDYARRKQDAVSGRTLSLYSQPFYTSPFGYRMCARAYLNGDGVGRGTHLSLFFVVMRGEYDALLPWPFRQRVTLTLLDQGAARRQLSDTFKPDPASSSFRRPTSDMNIASGCPLFVSHVALESASYLQDDTIFIKVVVDTGELGDP